jgi:hypothetical protein
MVEVRRQDYSRREYGSRKRAATGFVATCLNASLHEEVQ